MRHLSNLSLIFNRLPVPICPCAPMGTASVFSGVLICVLADAKSRTGSIRPRESSERSTKALSRKKSYFWDVSVSRCKYVNVDQSTRNGRRPDLNICLLSRICGRSRVPATLQVDGTARLRSHRRLAFLGRGLVGKLRVLSRNIQSICYRVRQRPDRMRGPGDHGYRGSTPELLITQALTANPPSLSVAVSLTPQLCPICYTPAAKPDAAANGTCSKSTAFLLSLSSWRS